ncbi:MAG: protein kinase domain-containing protein [Pyrinomonadaceae bacterium]
MLTSNQILQKGRYRVIEQFSHFGDSGLYEAYDTVNNSKVVIKENAGVSGKVVTQSQREGIDAAFFGVAKVLTKIRHESLVGVRGYFSEIGSQYLVLEPSAGCDLNKFLDADEPRPDVSVVLGWANQLLGALQYLHKLSPPVFHCSIRPDNIWFANDKTAKLVMADIGKSPFPGSFRNHAAQQNDGTGDHYTPLEQLWPELDHVSQNQLIKDYDERSERVLLTKPDARSDIYSLGACLYHVMTGVLPPDALERSIAVHEGNPDPLKKPSDVNPAVPADISLALLKAMEIRRELRFYSAAVMSKVLHSAMPENTTMMPETSENVELELDLAPVAAPEIKADVGLELERMKAEERQRELEAEQAKLDEELKQIEGRRIALEAEKEKQIEERKRLELLAEQERLRVEMERRIEEKKRLEAKAQEERESAVKRLAELEAEQEEKRIEAERLEREAEDERKSVEAKLASLHAEKEKNQAEQRQAAAAIKQELERAEETLLELSGLDPTQPVKTAKTKDEEDVLEIGTDSPQTALRTVPEVFELFENEPPTAPEVPQTVQHSNFEFRDFQEDSPKIKLPIPILGAAAGFIVLLVIIGWMFMGGSDNTPPTPAETQSEFAGEAPSVPAVELPPATNETSPDLSQPSAASETVVSPDPTSNPTESGQAKKARTVPGAQPDKSKAQSAAPAKTPAPKKVTVDDLINDN